MDRFRLVITDSRLPLKIDEKDESSRNLLPTAYLNLRTNDNASFRVDRAVHSRCSSIESTACGDGKLEDYGLFLALNQWFKNCIHSLAW